MTIDLSQFRQTFIEESLEGLDDMERNLLHLEVGAVDNEQINSIFRAAHSIKGGSSTFGYEHVSRFTHVLETLLDEMREGVRVVTSESVDVLLESVDVLRGMISVLQDDGDYDQQRASAVHSRLESILHGDKSVSQQIGRQNDSEKQKVHQMSGWSIYFKPHSNMMQTGNDPVRMLRELSLLGEMRVKPSLEDLPSLDSYMPENSYISWRIELINPCDKASVQEVFAWVEDDCDLSIEPLVVTEPSTTAIRKAVVPSDSSNSDSEDFAEADELQEAKSKVPALKQVEKSKQSSTQSPGSKTASDSASIRVSIDKVDALINMVGELVITQSMLNQFAENEEITAAQIEQFRNGLSQLERNTRELQESVMGIRMLPISFIFSRFPRMVHDLSNKLDKRVELLMAGEGTELDKTVMEKIGDPLVHLLRNAIDHGIEMPDVRRKKGKSEIGKVKLKAFHQGGNIVIEIADDGAGLNKEKLLSKAREKGLVKEDDVLTDEQIHQLIFMPGFSTAAVVSDVSGRGVGMDVVKRNINSLGGSIEIQSEIDSGTTFRVRLPLTLAILDGQTIRTGQEVYIVPLVSIMESIQIKRDMVRLVGGDMEVFKLRDEYLPIIRLRDAFGIEDACTEYEHGLLVVVEGAGQRVGLFVDELLGQQQVVIKSLETNFKRVQGISGATILGDGSVSMILDVPGLIKLAALKKNIDQRAIA